MFSYITFINVDSHFFNRDSQFIKVALELSLHLIVVISRRQKRVQLMRIREKDAKKRQQAGGQEGTYRRKPTPVKRYAGDLLAPVSVTNMPRAVAIRR